MTLQQLEYIIALAKYKNFVKAAKYCFVTQPTLSMQIQKLEDYLQVIIFDRSKKPVVPTLLGKKIIEKAKETIRNSKEIEEIILNEKGLIQGDFKLGIIPSIADTLIPRFLKEFTQNYPNVNLIITELQTDILVKKLKDEDIDAGIASTPLHEKDIIEQNIYYEPFFIYLYNNHKLLKKRSLNNQDLLNENILLMSDGHCFKTQAMQVCKLNQAQIEHKKKINFESSNFQTLIQLVNQEIGITLLPYYNIKTLSAMAQSNNIRKIKGKNPVREVSLLSKRSILKKGIIDSLLKIILNSTPPELKKYNPNQDAIIRPT